ncbi:MAG: hypothetical protein GDA36_08395 [Rhodobacteraceae bacterium]|nr:hypothetical protein [Paracoccaceae bacterium]
MISPKPLRAGIKGRTMARKKTWTEKLEGGKPPHVTELAKGFAGFKPGQKLFIASPKLLQEKINQIPSGTTLDVVALRKVLAQEHGADGTCPVSTSIFLRVVAEAALDEMQAGKSARGITPFWRVVNPKSPLAKKLSCGIEFIEIQKGLEAAS